MELEEVQRGRLRLSRDPAGVGVDCAAQAIASPLQGWATLHPMTTAMGVWSAAGFWTSAGLVRTAYLATQRNDSGKEGAAMLVQDEMVRWIDSVAHLPINPCRSPWRTDED